MNYTLGTHLVQTSDWGAFKTLMGTPAIRVGDLQFTKHKLPGLPFYVGYAPRVNFFTQRFSWNDLKKKAKEERCLMIRFDVPNVLKTDEDGDIPQKPIREVMDNCRKSPKSTFAKWNVLLDISANEEDLIANFKSKTRYNAKLAARKGVTVKIENNENGIKIFNNLIRETAKRDGFLIHTDEYYKKVYETFKSHEKAYIMIAYFNNEPLAAWQLFINENTLYYPFGASSSKHRKLMASNLIAWEAIKLGKKHECTMFDMWGATNDEKDPFWGFTKFKLGYGGELVEYMNSYDFVTNTPLYWAFNGAYGLFWKMYHLLKRN